MYDNCVKFLHVFNVTDNLHLPVPVLKLFCFFSLHLFGSVHPNPGPELETIRINRLNVRSLVSHKVPGLFIPGYQFTK